MYLMHFSWNIHIKRYSLLLLGKKNFVWGDSTLYFMIQKTHWLIIFVFLDWKNIGDFIF